MRDLCPDCESPVALVGGTAARHSGGLTVTCDRVRVTKGRREYDPCGFAVHLTRAELIDAALRAAENKENA